MTLKLLPSPELLRKLLRYEPETGKLFWRERPAGMFAGERHWKMWNTRYAGREAFTSADGDGYLYGSIFGRSYRAHRVIWAMETGGWPSDQIDHEDHDRSNNRIKNLREASRRENGRNQSLPSTNSSGIIGVYWHRRSKKWRAQIKVDGSAIHLGYFNDLPPAVAVRAEAEIKYGFHRNHGASNPKFPRWIGADNDRMEPG